VLMGMLFCGCWMLVSSGLIMLNKWILVEEKFNYPILLASFGAPANLAPTLLILTTSCAGRFEHCALKPFGFVLQPLTCGPRSSRKTLT